MRLNWVNLTVAAGMVLAIPFASAIADSHGGPIDKRQGKMKAVGKAMGTVGKMAKGEADFDAEAALAAFVSMKEAVDGFETLFPEGTETGHDTEASPKIFSDRAGFEAKVAEFKATLDQLTASAPADLAALQASVGAAGKNCGGCHEVYRVKKN